MIKYEEFKFGKFTLQQTRSNGLILWADGAKRATWGRPRLGLWVLHEQTDTESKETLEAIEKAMDFMDERAGDAREPAIQVWTTGWEIGVSGGNIVINHPLIEAPTVIPLTDELFECFKQLLEGKPTRVISF